jgi:hypothetical protein
VVEEDAGDAEHLVGLAVVAREVEAGDLADAVGRARVEARRLRLRHLRHLAEHLRRPGEVEAAPGLKLAQRGEYEVRAVDVRVHRREAVGERLADERLRREVVALVELLAAEDVEDGGVRFQARRVHVDAVEQVLDAREAAPGVFERDAADEGVNLVAEVQKVFGEVAPVLAGDACDQCCFHKR